MTVGREDPEGGGQIVEEGAGGDGDAVEDGGLNGAFRDDEIDEEVENENLDDEGEQGGGVVVEGLAPVGRPVMEGPESVEEEVGPAAEEPGEGGHAGDDGVVGGMPAEVVVAEGEKKPDEEGVEEGAEGADAAEANDAQDFGAVQAGPGFLPGRGGDGRFHGSGIMAGRDGRGNWVEQGKGEAVQEEWRETLATGRGRANLSSRCAT